MIVIGDHLPSICPQRLRCSLALFQVMRFRNSFSVSIRKSCHRCQRLLWPPTPSSSSSVRQCFAAHHVASNSLPHPPISPFQFHYVSWKHWRNLASHPFSLWSPWSTFYCFRFSLPFTWRVRYPLIVNTRLLVTLASAVQSMPHSSLQIVHLSTNGLAPPGSYSPGVGGSSGIFVCLPIVVFAYSSQQGLFGALSLLQKFLLYLLRLIVCFQLFSLFILICGVFLIF